MFSIVFENEVYDQWSCEYVFKSFVEAKLYLRSKGFIEKRGLFYREGYNWIEYTKAYISPRKIWQR